MEMLKRQTPKIKIAKQLGVHRSTLRRFLQEIEGSF